MASKTTRLRPLFHLDGGKPHLQGARPAAFPAAWYGLLFVCLAAVLYGLYRPALPAPFYFDTQYHLLKKSNLHMVEITPETVDRAVRFDVGGKIYRPMANLSLALTHRWFGLDPAAYRIGNILIHAAAATALLFLFVAVLDTPRVSALLPKDARPAAFGAAVAAVLLWAVHPVQSNVVAYVIQRMASLAGLFTFLSVGAYLRARSGNAFRIGWLLASAAFLCLGILSKQNAVTILPAVALAEWCLLGRPSATGRARSRAAFLAGGAVLAAGIAFVAWGPHDLAAVWGERAFTPWQRMLTEIRLQARYLLVLLVPDPRLLTLDAEVSVSSGWLSPPSTLAVGLAVAAALGLAVWRRRAQPLLAFGILWFFAHQLVEGTVLPLELYYEHRMYIPSAFLFFGLAWAGWRLAARFPRLAIAPGLAVAALLAVEAGATAWRARIWAEPVVFWADAVAKSRSKARPLTNLGVALVRDGRYDAAEGVLREALRLGAAPDRVLTNLATAAFKAGRLTDARRYLDDATASGGDRPWLTYRSRANLNLYERRLDDAERDVREVLRARPHDAEAWHIWGTIALIQGDDGEAERRLRRAVDYDPAFHKAWNNLGALYFRAGRFDDAVQAFRRAARLRPDDPKFTANLRKAKRAAEKGGVRSPGTDP